MERAADPHSTLPGMFLGAATPRARPPQLVASPPAATEQATQHSRLAKLDQRFSAILRGFVAGFACDGAEFYLLDATTSDLVLRTQYKSGECEAGANRRSLATARADVAAMAGSAIVLEDDLEVAGWPVPVWCGAAVCLPVASDETIHGTLWLYSSEPRTFADPELQLAEVVAGRLAVELELARWREGAMECNDPAPSPEAAKTAPVANVAQRVAPASIRAGKPATPLLLEDWELAGWLANEPAGPTFFDWQTLADGRTLVATGALANDACSADGWLQAARIALRAHAPASHDAGELLTEANRTLWLASPGGEGLAVAVAILDGDGARTSVAAAGDAGIARWRAAKCEWTTVNCPPLGWSERAVYAQQNDELMVRERLVLVAAPAGVPDRRMIERLAERLRRGSPDDLRSMPGKRALRVFAAAAGDVGMHPGGMALIRRR